MKKHGLVLSGGGARGAYQAGVLQAVLEIASQTNRPFPFEIVTGVSAGAINATYLAANAHRGRNAADDLAGFWKAMTADRVFRTDATSLSRIGLRWLLDVTLGGLHKRLLTRSLLDTSPLRTLLQEHVQFTQIGKNMKAGIFESLSVTAADYGSATSISFVESAGKPTMWTRSRRHSERAEIGVDHIMGSSAIPLFFPPWKIGERFFGDGCLRNLAPLSPAVHLGSEKLLVVTLRRNQPLLEESPPKNDFRPSIARVISVLLNAIFMDATELDIERMQRVNLMIETAGGFTETQKQRVSLRPIEFLWIQPSEDIGALAQVHAKRLPKLVRYLLEGLGSLEEASEIVSYLLFDPTFCSLLVDLGHQDAMKKRSEIEAFLG